MIRRSDHNQTEIIAGLRAAGCTVTDLHKVGRGCPDLLVGFRGVNYLIEVKSDHGRLTPAESGWLESWRGSASVVTTLTQALEAIGLSDE